MTTPPLLLPPSPRLPSSVALDDKLWVFGLYKAVIYQFVSVYTLHFAGQPTIKIDI